jgi:hypothetical protein
MTLLDRIVMAMAVVQALAVVGVGIAGVMMFETFRKAKKAADPALNTAKAVADAGSAIVDHARTDGMAAVKRVTDIAQVVKRRAQTTVRIAKQIRPTAETTLAEVRARQADVLHTARHATGLAGSLNRLSKAARAATGHNGANGKS